jgi:hypothetical protein
MRALALAPLVFAACGGAGGDGAVPLGAQQLPGYRIDATATLALDQPGFGITGDGSGRFRVQWAGITSDVLEGTLTTDGVFDPPSTSPLGGKELIANEAGRIQFRLSPTAAYNGLDFATSAGPIYLDLTRNSDRVQTEIAFMRGGQRQLSAHDPVAIDVLLTR